MTEITRHFTATVFIVYNNKVLLIEHKKAKVWIGPGGHIDRDELPHEAAIREAKEEVGLDIELYSKNKNLTKYGDGSFNIHNGEIINVHNVNEFHQHIDFEFIAITNTDKVVPGPGESQTWQWFTKEEIENLNLRPNIKYMCLKALETLSN